MTGDESLVVYVENRGRRARLASGMEVWELIAAWKDLGESWERLREAYPELPEAQVRAALDHYVDHPDEIDERLALEEYWTPERTYAEMPFTRPAYLRDQDS